MRISTLVACLSRMATVLKISRKVVAQVRNVSQVGSLGAQEPSDIEIVDQDGFEEIPTAQRQTSLKATWKTLYSSCGKKTATSFGETLTALNCTFIFYSLRILQQCQVP